MDIRALLCDPESPESKICLAPVISSSTVTRKNNIVPAAYATSTTDAASSCCPNASLSPHPQSHPLDAGPVIHHDLPSLSPSPSHQVIKRQASETLPDDRPAKRQPKWTTKEDNCIIALRGQGMKWDNIAKRLPERTSIACRLRYQNYLEKRATWDEEKKNKLARLYARFKDQMWQRLATEMDIPWRSAESMHWQIGEQEMGQRAKASLFQAYAPTTTIGSSSQSTTPSAQASSPTSHAFTPANAAPLMPNHPPALAQQGLVNSLPPTQESVHSSHQRTNSESRKGRRRNHSSRHQGTVALSMSSIPLPLSQPMPHR